MMRALNKKRVLCCLFCSIENRKINKEAFDAVNEIYHELFPVHRYSDWNTSKE
jgi:hypothetical protein